MNTVPQRLCGFLPTDSGIQDTYYVLTKHFPDQNEYIILRTGATFHAIV